MRISVSMRAARACAAGTLFLSLAVTPANAHMAGPSARAGTGASHFATHGSRGFNRFGANRFGFNGFRFDRFEDHRFRFDRFGFNRFGANALDFGLLGLAGLGYWGYPTSFPTASAGPIIVGEGGPPLVINVYADRDPGGGEVGAADGGVPRASPAPLRQGRALRRRAANPGVLREGGPWTVRRRAHARPA